MYTAALCLVNGVWSNSAALHAAHDPGVRVKLTDRLCRRRPIACLWLVFHKECLWTISDLRALLETKR